MKKILQRALEVTVCLLVFLVFLQMYYPSYKEGQLRPKINASVSIMLKYAQDNNARTSDFVFPEVEIDPLSGQPFVYGTREDLGWYIISVGPDKELNYDLSTEIKAENFIVYDPTNGYFSSGDIIFTNLW